MEKKTINTNEPSFIQSINISNEWCKEWEENLLSDEVLSDRISELIKSKNGLRGFFAYALSDIDCTLLDKLPTSIIYTFRQKGEALVEITVKNLIMSAAQSIYHHKNNNIQFSEKSENICERCINLLRELDTNLVTENINNTILNLDSMGNSFDNSVKYNKFQKKYILEKIKDIAI